MPTKYYTTNPRLARVALTGSSTLLSFGAECKKSQGDRADVTLDATGRVNVRFHGKGRYAVRRAGKRSVIQTRSKTLGRKLLASRDNALLVPVGKRTRSSVNFEIV